MLEYDRIDILEGIDVNKKMHQKNVIFLTIGILKILFLSMSHIFAMVVMIWCKRLWILMMLKEVLVEFTFGIWAKMMQLAQWMILIWLTKKVVYNFFLLRILDDWFNLLSKKQRSDSK